MAATSGPEIQVFAMFRPTPTSLRWKWVHCLTIPLDMLHSLGFTRRPLKWIRYATGIVVGARGDLSWSDLLPDIMDYDVCPTLSMDLFYHINDAERQKMFPIDPDMQHPRIHSGRAATARETRFKSAIAARDQRCVLSPFFKVYDCDAAHLVPHSKGNAYIETYTHHRTRDPGEEDVITHVDDVRNGILLNSTAHRHFGLHSAFLITPNFAMDTTDIDSNASLSEARCTAHLFFPDESQSFGLPGITSGHPVQTLGINWPPSILFDAVYADLFRAEELDQMLQGWKSVFYPGGIESEAQADHREIMQGLRREEAQARR